MVRIRANSQEELSGTSHLNRHFGCVMVRIRANSQEEVYWYFPSKSTFWLCEGNNSRNVDVL